MTPEQLADARSLIAGARVLALGVVVDGEPHVGLLPYAVGEDPATLLVHASKLARHSRGLLPGAEFSALIHESDRGEGDPLQLRRVILQGRVIPLARDTGVYLDARARYLARLPTAEITFRLGDFTLFALHAESGRYVGGFAQAVDLRAADLRGG
jgi:putative heme iron utilization protein